MSEFIIRHGTVSDAERVMMLRKNVSKEAGNKNPPLDPYGGSYPTVEQQVSEIEKFGSTAIFLIALNSDQIVGAAFCFQIYNQPHEYRVKFLVDSKWRRKGVGTELILKIVDWSKSHRDVEKLFCSFHTSHKDARHILEKFGFVILSEGYASYTQGARYHKTEMCLTFSSKS